MDTLPTLFIIFICAFVWAWFNRPAWFTDPTGSPVPPFFQWVKDNIGTPKPGDAKPGADTGTTPPPAVTPPATTTTGTAAVTGTTTPTTNTSGGTGGASTGTTGTNTGAGSGDAIPPDMVNINRAWIKYDGYAPKSFALIENGTFSNQAAAHQCVPLCLANGECTGFKHHPDASGGQCQLLKNSGNEKGAALNTQAAPYNTGTYWFRNRQWTYHKDKEHRGDDIKFIGDVSVDRLQDVCLETPGCVALNWSSSWGNPGGGNLKTKSDINNTTTFKGDFYVLKQ